jgi:hypothetical protein
MRPRDAHGPGLGVQTIAEWRTQGVDAPADTLLGLQDDRFVPGALEFMGRHQPCHAGTDDDDFFWIRRMRFKPALDESQVINRFRHSSLQIREL